MRRMRVIKMTNSIELTIVMRLTRTMRATKPTAIVGMARLVEIS